MAASLMLLAAGMAATQSSGSAQAPVQLLGSFSVRGRITVAVNVRGERVGQRLARRWRFSSPCGARPCTRWILRRRRSELALPDRVALLKRPGGLYTGTGRFWVSLRCAGSVQRHGGLATESISVRPTRVVQVGATRFAVAFRASYRNPERLNRTRCPGGIGHDAATYAGRLTSPLPGPPTPAFGTSEGGAGEVSFLDRSRAGRGGAAIVAWAWNFGDSAGAQSTSSARDPSHVYALPGIYTVTLTITDAYGQRAAVQQQVTVA